MSKKIELNLTMHQLIDIRYMIACHDKNGTFADIYNIIDEKIEMNTEPEETNNDEEE